MMLNDTITRHFLLLKKYANSFRFFKPKQILIIECQCKVKFLASFFPYMLYVSMMLLITNWILKYILIFYIVTVDSFLALDNEHRKSLDMFRLFLSFSLSYIHVLRLRIRNHRVLHLSLNSKVQLTFPFLKSSFTLVKRLSVFFFTYILPLSFLYIL